MITWARVSDALANARYQVCLFVGTAPIGPCAGSWAVKAAVGFVINHVVVEESVVCDHLVSVFAVAVTSW